jgi:hypothetical protein
LLLDTAFSGLLPFFGFVLKLIRIECCFVTKTNLGQIEIEGVLAAE